MLLLALFLLLLLQQQLIFQGAIPNELAAMQRQILTGDPQL
jgi:hypothetical protein